MSIVNGDLLDEGLQNVMGKERCQNEWKPAKKVSVEDVETAIANSHEEAYGHKKMAHNADDASWSPTKESNWMDSMKSCAKSVLLFGGLSFLVFYWQQAGLMDSSVAVPTMCICTALAGLGVGKNIGGGVQ